MTAYASTVSESLTTLDSYRAIMPAWISVTREGITTNDTQTHQYTAVRPISDITGSAELGNIGLPLLFTSGGNMESVLRGMTQSRVAADTISSSDSLGDRLSAVAVLLEDISGSLLDQITAQQTLKRTASESIPYHGETVAKTFFASRTFIEQIGTDLSVSPMLLFPMPHNDVLVRTSGHARIIGDTLHLTDVLSYVKHMARVYTETHTTSESALVRALTLHRLTIDTRTTTDSMLRAMGYHRVPIENYPYSETLLRHLTQFRTLTQTGTTNDVLTGHSFKFRPITETLSTQDTVTSLQLLGAIMGYIWIDAQGNVIADMPDWGFVLVEDPTAGNILNVMPIPTTQLDPTREK